MLLLLSHFSRVRLLVTPGTAWSLPGSSIHGIFQARVLEWGAIAFSDRMLNKGEFLSGQYLEALVLLPVRDLGCWGRVAAGSLAGEAWGREKAS